jgi:hypothetical protein
MRLSTIVKKWRVHTILVMALGLVLPVLLHAQVIQQPLRPPLPTSLTPVWSSINTSPDPCRDVLVAYGSSAITPVTAAGTAGGGSSEVPVFDNDTNLNLSNIVNLLAGNNTTGVQGEYNTRIASNMLRLLCEKEYVLDREIQNAWREVIGGFVDYAINWINTAYDGNPIYVTNPYIYYRNIEIGVTQAMLEEVRAAITAGDIDEERGRAAMRLMLLTISDTSSVGGLVDWTGNNPVMKLEFEDPNEFSYDSFFFGTQEPLNQDLERNILRELDRRRSSAKEIESQKLSWGRGYFPWEYCGLPVFSEDPVDIRTCYIFSPGSTIQDLSTWVLSSALRQMELNDEYEEYIATSSLSAMSSVFSNAGLYWSQDVVGDVVTSDATLGSRNTFTPTNSDFLVDNFDGIFNSAVSAAASGQGWEPSRYRSTISTIGIDPGLISFILGP